MWCNNSCFIEIWVIFIICGLIVVAEAEKRVEKPDFIVVGAGTSGCVLAARLCTELPSAKIVLLERGLERSAASEFKVRSPPLALDVSGDGSVTEIWQSLPNKGLLGRRSTITTGKTLGGSSAINGMQWSVPLHGTVEKWNIAGLSSRVAAKFYSRAYEKVGFSQQPKALRQIYADDFIKASGQAGFSNEFDPFDQKSRYAVFDHSVAVNASTGRRIDSCTAYISPVLNNECARNLNLIQGVTVTKLILNSNNPKRATGLEYVSSNDRALKKRMLLHVGKEILLAAGPFGSPKILQLSGIGPAEHLRMLGIDPVVNIPVGLQTQARGNQFVTSLYTGVPLEPSNNSTILNSKEELELWERGEPSAWGKNPAATISVHGRIAYSVMLTGFGKENLDVPLLGGLCQGNPSSFGYLLINDSNPFSTPEVQLNILGRTADYVRLRKCIEKTVQVHQRFPASFKLSLVSPSGTVNETFIRSQAEHAAHFVGGCAVGKVLENNLKIRGVESVRVIDSSAFSTIPISAGPLASTYMLAEYASEMLVSLYKNIFS